MLSRVSHLLSIKFVICRWCLRRWSASSVTHRGENKRQLREARDCSRGVYIVYLQLCAKCFAQPPASHPLIPYRLFHPAQQKCVTARRLYTRRVTGRARFYINRQSDARNALATLWLSELRRAAPHRLLIIIFSRPRWHLALNDVNCDINHLCDGQREKWLYEDYMESDA
jgi:hypothetical protein